MSRVFTYKGKTLEELNAMSIEELIELLPARARRSLKRSANEQNIKLQMKIKKILQSGNKNKVIKTHCRDMIILPEMVGAKIGVHKGNEFVVFEITPEHIGHYLGEYALTRKPVKHGAAGIGATRSSKFTAQRK